MLEIDVWQYFLELFFIVFFVCFDIFCFGVETSISLRSSCFKNVASREVSFRKIFPSYFLLFGISPRRKLHLIYIPLSKFGKSPASVHVV